MSDRAEDLVKQLLEKTQADKLAWTFVPEAVVDVDWANSEKYRADLEDGFSFSISRKTRNDDKLIDFELTQLGRIILSSQADNLPMLIGPKTRRLLELRNAMRDRDDEKKLAEPIDISKVARFRLFSDLFHAAKQSAVGGDQTIERVQQLLERIG